MEDQYLADALCNAIHTKQDRNPLPGPADHLGPGTCGGCEAGLGGIGSARGRVGWVLGRIGHGVVGRSADVPPCDGLGELPLGVVERHLDRVYAE